MLEEAEAILTAISALTPVSVRQAVYVGMSGSSALVDMGGERFTVEYATGYIPVTGETVRVWSVGGQHLLFPGGPRPTVGTVLTVPATLPLLPPSGRATVQTSVGVVSATIAGSTAPAVGARVGLIWSEDGPWCVGPLSATAASTPAPPPLAVPVRSATFQAIDAGSTDRGTVRWWNPQPWASDSTFGAWFYGTQIKDTIPARAEFVSLEFYVSPQQQSGQPRFALHDAPTKTGIPGFGAVTGWTPSPGWQTPPDPGGWFTALKEGGPMAGIGLNQGGVNTFSSLAQDSMSGALRVSWRV